MSIAGRLTEMEAGVGSEAEARRTSWRRGETAVISPPLLLTSSTDSVHSHTPCCHNTDTFFLLFRIEEEGEVWHNLQSCRRADREREGSLICQDSEEEVKKREMWGFVKAHISHFLFNLIHLLALLSLNPWRTVVRGICLNKFVFICNFELSCVVLHY